MILYESWFVRTTLLCAIWGTKATTDEVGGCGVKPVFLQRESDSEKPGESAKGVR